MGAAGLNLKDAIKRITKNVDKVPITQGALFVVPPLVIMFISYALFALLKHFYVHQLNVFSITVMSAIILSLVGTASMHFLIYRIVADSKYSKDEAASRGIRLGIIYSVAFSVVASGLLYPYFQNVLNLSLFYFSCFAILLTLYSMTWVLTTAFWAVGQYKYPAFVFALSYLAVFSLSYGFYQANPDATIIGYTGGIAVLPWLSLVAARRVFREQLGIHKLSDDLSTIPKMIFRNYPAILFYTFYALAIFLDKIIVWLSEGARVGSELMLVGPYTVGAFLGLIPMFSIAALAYFSSKIKPLAEDMYEGTLIDIQKRIEKYKDLYWKGLRAMLIIGFVLFILATAVCYYFVLNPLVLRISVTTSLGVLFFVVIVYNSVVLPIFGKTSISTVSMLVVCISESLAILFVASDVWYASVGFLVGSFIGFLISHFSTIRLFPEFDYNLFRPHTAAA